jgi:hypothetical protein
VARIMDWTVEEWAWLACVNLWTVLTSFEMGSEMVRIDLKALCIELTW